jgi:hypothetical protein
MVPFHGLKKLRGRFQILLPKGKEVAQSAPDLQMVVGRGQIERESWQGEASGLGTLSPGPPPLPPLMDSLFLLALPLLGGRAVGFTRGLGAVEGPVVLLVVGPLLPTLPLLGVGGPGVGVGFGAVGSSLIQLKFCRLQSLFNAGVVAKQMCKGRLAKLQGWANGLGCSRFPNQVSEVVNALIEGTGGDPGSHVGNSPKTLANVVEILLSVPQGGKERLWVLRGILGKDEGEALHNI